MTSFKKTEIIKFPEYLSDPVGDSGWGRWEHPVTIQEYGAINKIDISPHAPNYFAITSYSKVLLYNPVIKDVYKTLTKFQDAALGAKFRRDGKLLCVGTSEGQIKVFDVATKTLLRILKGHMTATHRCDFTADTTHVVSFSDDKSVGYWDLPSETLLHRYSQHTDYVRCGAPCNVSSDLFVSGSYDQTVRMWDRRIGSEPVITVQHGAPVEDVVVMPGDGLVVSAGGNQIKVWDITGGGRELVSISPHHKTVTCLCIADSGGTLVTGSLDRQVKRVDMQTFQVTGSLAFPSSVLSVGVHDKFVVGGMVDGLVQIYERKEEQYRDGVKVDSRRTRKEKSHRYLKYTHFEPAPGDIVVDNSKTDIELKHDNLLRKYEYSKALDQTLKPFVQRKKPEYAHSLFYELMRRDGLRTALVGRDEKSLLLVLSYVNRYIMDDRFSKVLLYVAGILVDLYLPRAGQSSKVERMFTELERKLDAEHRYVEEIILVQGAVDLIISSASAGQNCSRIEKEILAKTS